MVIIGAGAAGLHCAIELMNQCPDWSFLIIDKHEKRGIIDRTWCYWESKESIFDEYVTSSWNQAGFISAAGVFVNLDLGSYTYKMVPSDKFYDGLIKQIKESKNGTYQVGEINSLENKNDGFRVKTISEQFSCHWILDSRPPSLTKIDEKKHYYIQQHFLGIHIKTTKSNFNPKKFIMMDYSHGLSDQTAFFYVLPFSENEALVEYTFFDKNPLKEEEYVESINTYLKSNFEIDSYEVVNMESGNIPMTNAPLSSSSSNGHIHIGTPGGWLRPSTGYSFLNSRRFSKNLISSAGADAFSMTIMIRSSF